MAQRQTLNSKGQEEPRDGHEAEATALVGARQGKVPCEETARAPGVLAFSERLLQKTTTSDEKATRMDVKYHEPLNFHDGNIVLTALEAAGQQIAFRIHQPILATHSPIFADMLSLPSCGPETETYDGVPLVRMPDKAEDLKSLLEVLYCRPMLRLKRYDPNTPIIVKPLLMLAAKYEIEHLRSTIVQQLEEDWPQTLGAWDGLELEIEAKTTHASRQYQTVSDDSEYPDLCFPEPAAAIQLARLCNIHSNWNHIRADGSEAYYTGSDLAGGIRTARWELLERGDFLCLLRGKERLKDAVDDCVFGIQRNKHPHKGKEVDGCKSDNWSSAWMSLQTRFQESSDILETLLRYEDTEAPLKIGRTRLCRPCEQAIREETVLLRDEVWEKMHEFFSLPKP